MPSGGFAHNHSTPPHQSIEPHAVPDQGTLDGRWKLLEPIGSGQLGTTYKAISIEEAREVVVKILDADVAANPRIAKRFLQECKKASSIHQKNIATIFDYGRLPDGRPYVVSEFCPTTLAMTIEKEGFLDVDEALKLAEDVCDGLTAAHQSDIVHRGLKPENILILNDTAKLTDVGVAKALPSAGREAMDLTATSFVFGDPVYASPEQCQGFRVDERSDIYSLGAVLYHALTGKRPFGSKKGIQLALAQLTETPKSFDKVMFNCDIPQDVELLVRKCMEKDPLLRYQSIAMLKHDINTLKNGKRLLARDTKSAIPLVVPLKIRHHARTIVMIALAILLLIPVIMLATTLFTAAASSLSQMSLQPTQPGNPRIYDLWSPRQFRKNVNSVRDIDLAKTTIEPSFFAISQPNLPASSSTDDETIKMKEELLLGENQLSRQSFAQAKQTFETVYKEAKQDSWEQTKAAGYLAYIAAKVDGMQFAENKFGTAAALLVRHNTLEAHIFAAQVKYVWGDTVSRSAIRPRSEAKSIFQQARNELILAAAASTGSPYFKLYQDVEKRISELNRNPFARSKARGSNAPQQLPNPENGHDPYALKNQDL